MTWPEIDGPNRALLWLGFMLFSVVALRDRPRPAVPEELDLPGFALEDVAGFSLRQGIRSVEIERRAQGWAIVDPESLAGPARAGRVEELLQAWAPPRRSTQKAARDLEPNDLARLGLGRTDTLHLIVEGPHEQELLSIEVGSTAPRGGRYVREEGLKAIFVAEVAARHLITPDPLVWVNPRGGRAPRFELPPTGPASVIWTGAEGDVELLRDAEGVWSQRGGRASGPSDWADALAPLMALRVGRPISPGARSQRRRSLRVTLPDQPPLLLEVLIPDDILEATPVRIDDTWYALPPGSFTAWTLMD